MNLAAGKPVAHQLFLPQKQVLIAVKRNYGLGSLGIEMVFCYNSGGKGNMKGNPGLSCSLFSGWNVTFSYSAHPSFLCACVAVSIKQTQPFSYLPMEQIKGGTELREWMDFYYYYYSHHSMNA